MPTAKHGDVPTVTAAATVDPETGALAPESWTAFHGHIA